MYRSTPGIKSKFQGVALHPYTGSYKNLTSRIEEVRGVLIDNHDAGKGLWITELGWSSQPPEARQQLRQGLERAGAAAEGRLQAAPRQTGASGISQRVYWFSVDDLTGACNFCDGSGLFGEGFMPKPSWHAYVKFAGGRP